MTCVNRIVAILQSFFGEKKDVMEYKRVRMNVKLMDKCEVVLHEKDKLKRYCTIGLGLADRSYW